MRDACQTVTFTTGSIIVFLAFAILPIAPVVADLKGAGQDVLTGVYTREQAYRGAQLFRRHCSYCHGATLNGGEDPNGPPLKGHVFTRRWQGTPVAQLFATVLETMPANDPGTLSEQASVDLVSFIFAANNWPPGDAELAADTAFLERILIVEKPKALK